MRRSKQWKYKIEGYSLEHGNYTDGYSVRYRNGAKETQELVQKWVNLGFKEVTVKTFDYQEREYK